MSLGIVIKGPEGLVLAAESRATLSAKLPSGDSVHVNYDNATKLIALGEPHNHIGIVTYGQAGIGFRTAQSFMAEFEATAGPRRTHVSDYAENLSAFFLDKWSQTMPKDYKGIDMTFAVAGFNDGDPYGSVYLFEIPRSPAPRQNHALPDEFGITWGGQGDLVQRLLQGYDGRLMGVIQASIGATPDQLAKIQAAASTLQLQIPLQAMALQDCVDLAIFFVRTTINGQALSVGIRGCGGDIDVATITRREGLKFVQRKQIIGESGSTKE